MLNSCDSLNHEIIPLYAFNQQSLLDCVLAYILLNSVCCNWSDLVNYFIFELVFEWSKMAICLSLMAVMVK